MAVNRLLDTNAILYLLSGRLAELLAAGKYFVSVITEMELLSYPLLDTEQESHIQGVLSKVMILDLNNEIKKTAIKIRRAHGLKLPDAIIAATTMVINAELLTNDRKLQSVPGITVRSLVLKDALT